MITKQRGGAIANQENHIIAHGNRAIANTLRFFKKMCIKACARAGPRVTTTQ